jgi:hypothetical protein
MNKQTIAAVLAMFLVTLLIAQLSWGAPTGASITYNVTAGSPNPTASNASHARGTITTMVLNAVQQDQQWKAYVGNITGKLSLDDASGNTIYDWSISAVNKSGEVYVTRSSTISWTTVTCVSATNITAEEIFHNMTAAQSDNIRNTFNAFSHAQFFVGTVSIAANSCNSTATYRNDLPQTIDGTQKFQEVMLRDDVDNVIFVALVEGNYSGFDNRQYDFQMVVPESDVKTTNTTYYFFTELNG